ncbi:MAG: EAL domain-containing protein [Solirubrobacteraceae bacterium]|nr:EAL domain-containing protein [Solirubrobacteraceae bacterium]
MSTASPEEPEAAAQPGPSALRRIPLGAIVISGVVLVASWAVVAFSISSTQRSRDQARQLELVAANASALNDLASVFDAATNIVVLERGVSASITQYGVIARTLRNLPPTDDVDDLRARVVGLIGPGLRLQTEVNERDVPGAIGIDRTIIAPRIDGLERAARGAAARQLARAERAETIAWVASGIALLVGSAGLALVALLITRTRERAVFARTRAELEERGASRLDALVGRATDAVTVLDGDGRVTWISRTPSFPLADAPEAIPGKYFTDLLHPADRRRGAAVFTELLATPGGTATTHLRLETAGGDQRPVEVHGENRLDDPAIDGVILTVRDVSERTLLEDQLERLASRDPITGVANRAQLEAHLGNAVTRRDSRGGFAGLLLVDLDDFRAVSDTLGHDAGDELLRHAARRLERAAGEGDLVARLDGDTFGVLLDHLRSVGDGQARAASILSALRGRAAITGGHSVDLDAHGGLAFGAIDLPAREIIRHADIALLEARARKVPHVVSFTDQMLGRVTERVALTGDLRRATEREEFDVDYQPIVDIATGRTVGVEALARWAHPDRGRLAPGAFVDLAEQTGLIRPLGELVLRKSCRDIAELLEESPDALDYVSVNVSPRQLEDPDLTEVVLSALGDAGLAPEHLMLELTERSIASDPTRLIRRLTELRELGVKIALDDFGAGYSFLSFLEQYPLDALKIDRSLSRTMAHRQDAALLLQGIVQMGTVNGMSVIVEGIETLDQRQRAEELGIPLGQGYLFSRPKTLSALELA